MRSLFVPALVAEATVTEIAEVGGLAFAAAYIAFARLSGISGLFRRMQWAGISHQVSYEGLVNQVSTKMRYLDFCRHAAPLQKP
jgi:hypothetical protein